MVCRRWLNAGRYGMGRVLRGANGAIGRGHWRCWISGHRRAAGVANLGRRRYRRRELADVLAAQESLCGRCGMRRAGSVYANPPEPSDSDGRRCTPMAALYRTTATGRNRGMARMSTAQLISTLTCPACGARSTETMPTDACQYFYDCPSCGTMLKPKAGDCCVFCSYGDVPCPPIQADGKTCCGSSENSI